MSAEQGGDAAYEATAATARLQLPSLNWQKDWRPAGLKARLERDFPPLFKAGCGLSGGERARLRQMVELMQNCLDATPNEKQMARLLENLFNALQNPAKNHNIKPMMNTYRVALDGVAEPILRKAVGDIIRGRVEVVSKVFVPSCAELMHCCDDLTTKARGCLVLAQQLLGTPEAQAVERISPERAQEMRRQIGLAIQGGNTARGVEGGSPDRE